MRFPLATPLESRDGTVTRDAKCLNCIIESRGQETPPIARPRPGNSRIGLIKTGTAQLLYYWNGQVNAVIGDFINTAIVSPSRNTTWNPSDTAANIVLSGGNLTLQTFVADTARFSRSVLSVSSGTWYFEVTLGATVNGANIGLANATAALISDFGGAAGNGIAYRNSSGIIVKGGSTLSSVATATTGDVIGVYYNADAGTISWYKNNVLLYTATGSNVPTGPLYAAGGSFATANNTFTVNFGATAFVYGAPGGASTNLSPTTAGLQFTAQDNGANAAQSYLMFKNSKQAWTLDTSGNVLLISDVDYPGNYTVTLTSLTRSGTVATATTASATNFQVGSSVTIAGATPSTYNGAQTITAVTGGTFVDGGAAIAITLSRSGTTATATSVSVPHGYTNGQTVTIAGAIQAAYNGTYVIAWISATSFSYTVVVTSNALASPATGSPAISTISFPGAYANSAGALNTFQITTYSPHGLQVGDTVTQVANIGGAASTSGTVATVPTASSFTLTTSGIVAVLTGGASYFRTNLPTVSSITSAAGVATVTTSAAHRLPTPFSGAVYIVISGCTQTAYNLALTNYTILDATHFTYVIPGGGDDPVTPATGTITSTGADSVVGASFTFTIAGSPATPATGTITATGGRTTVPGIAYVDGRFVVMDTNGVLYESLEDQPQNWNALEYVSALAETGVGKACKRSANYIVAFKEWSLEPFYNAKLPPPGAIFAPLENGLVQVGCVSGESVADVDGSLFWISQVKRTKGRTVHRLDGLQATPVSTPHVERILNLSTLATVRSYGVKLDGGMCYVLTLTDLNITLIYHVTAGVWSTWSSNTLGVAVNVSTITYSGTTVTVTTSGAHGLSDGDPALIAGVVQSGYNGIQQAQVTSATIFTYEVATGLTSPTGTVTVTPYTETYFKFGHYTDSGDNVLLHESDGYIYKIDSSLYQDAGIPINVFSRSPRFDGGTKAKKRMGSVTLVADTVTASAAIRWSDDDCQTYTHYRLVSLARERPRLRRCGSFRSRTMEMRFIANSPERFEALEMEID